MVGFQLRTQDNFKPSFLGETNALQKLILTHTKAKYRIAGRRLYTMSMVVCIHRGQKLGEIAILPEPLFNILVVLYIRLLELKVHGTPPDNRPEDTRILNISLRPVTAP